MSFIKEYRAYSSLTPDQKRFIEDKYLEASRTPTEWLAFFRQIAVYDLYGDSARKFLKKAGWASGVVAFISIILAFAGFFIPLLIALPVAIAAVVLYYIKKKSDLPNNFRQFMVPLVSILREEMNPGEQLFLHIDFRGGTHDNKQVSAPRPGGAKKSAFLSSGTIDEKYFSDRWLTGRALLADHTRLELDISDFIRERKVTRRNARGKTKVKIKYKIKTLIDARLQLPQEDYAVLSQGAGEGDKVSLKSGEKRSAIRVRRAVISRELDSVLSLNQALDVIARAYRQVSPSKSGGK